MNPSISASTASVTGGTAFSLQAEKPSAGQRWISFGEFLLGSAIVIGHNLYRVVPNEVPILFVFALILFRLRDGWSALGLRWPASWRRTILIAVAAAVLRLLVGTLVIEPVTAHFWPPAIAPSGMKDIAGHGMQALKWFLLVWTFAAIGEEIGYRGYLINRAADAGGRSKAVYWIAVVLVSVLSGYGHYYKGPAGIVDSGMAGLVLGAAYVLSGRNLWVCVLAHGFIDTIGLIAVLFGWSS
jgi:membrane protease YdiL (CAAX protease family)